MAIPNPSLSTTSQPVIRDLFPASFKFPSVNSLDEETLRLKLREIFTRLEENGITLRLQERVPARVVYAYFTAECLREEIMFPGMPNGYSQVLDGCNTLCVECFQAKWCDARSAPTKK